MTERERELGIATSVVRVIRAAQTADVHYTIFSREGRENARLMRHHFDQRVALLEAAEKPADDTTESLAERVAALEREIENEQDNRRGMAKRMVRSENSLREHWHFASNVPCSQETSTARGLTKL
jgi:uncharacterized coiled-coil protein SlyX